MDHGAVGQNFAGAGCIHVDKIFHDKRLSRSIFDAGNDVTWLRGALTSSAALARESNRSLVVAQVVYLLNHRYSEVDNWSFVSYNTACI